MIVPLWAKAVAALAVVGAIAGGGYYIKDLQADNKELRKQMNAAIDRIKTAEDDNKRQDQIFLRRDELHEGERDSVADVTVRIKQEASKDENTRTTGNTRIPDGMRRAVIEAATARAATERKSTDGTDKDRRGTQK